MARKRRKTTPFGTALKKARARSGLSQSEVESALGLPQSAVSQYETVGRDPRLSRLIELANLFDISLDELVDRTA